MIKKILRSEDVYIQFTPEEIAELGWEPNQKFSMDVQEDGSVKLTKFAKIEIDLDEWPVELLQHLIAESCERDISVNDVINDSLKSFCDQYNHKL